VNRYALTPAQTAVKIGEHLFYGPMLGCGTNDPSTMKSQFDPGFLESLSKEDVISRFRLLKHQTDHERHQTREFHRKEMARLVTIVGKAGHLWNVMLESTRYPNRGRKTVRIQEVMDEANRRWLEQEELVR